MTNFRLFQTESSQATNFDFIKVAESSPTGEKTLWEKGENVSLGAISPFPTVFPKDLHCRHVKTRACLGMG